MTIRDTTKTDPALLLLEALAGGPSNMIERMEAQGQREVVASSELPVRMDYGQDKYEAIGIVFHEKKDPGDLFRPVTLPAGWKIVPSEHSMWSYVVDAQGRCRVGVFYKAAFYDRSAHMSLHRRFNLRMNYTREDYEKVREWQVLDCDTVVFRSVRLMPEGLDPNDRNAYLDARTPLDEEAYAECREWLKKHFPNWEDPTAHWDDPLPEGAL